MKIVTLLSGGLDSVTLAHYFKSVYSPEELITLSFHYGQRHGEKELHAAERAAKRLGATHHVIGIREVSEEGWSQPLGGLLGGSSLTNEASEIPDGHYGAASMKSTIVPNRNAIMLSIAYGIAVAEKASLVGFAAHAGDHAIYPDCRPDFVEMLTLALEVGNAWADPIPKLIAPFIKISKEEIAVTAVELGVLIEDTWSCYKGGEIHCGTCGTCFERREALVGVELRHPSFTDPTEYLDNTTLFAKPEEA